ncbi:hypothetical protein, partial [Escherichia coli]|uniref:hypothetical protein n=1 Tax=Escherichia coli TaxID=562 RepID=UPI00165F3A11
VSAGFLIGRLVGEMRGYLGVTSKLRTEKTPPLAGKHVADKLRFMLPDAAQTPYPAYKNEQIQ